MKMVPELEDAFNAQIAVEMGSSLAYLQMAAHFDSENLTGMSQWMRVQADEERAHAHRFIDFILGRGNQVRIGAIPAVRWEYGSVAEVFETALEQERSVTGSIHELYRLAVDKGDLACYPFLQDFINEQNEEESTVDTILERVRLAGDSSGAMLLLDTQLGSRIASEI